MRRVRDAALQAAGPARRDCGRCGVQAGREGGRRWAGCPEATSAEYGTKEVLSAVVIQGAIFGAVKAVVDRVGAKGFKKVTGADPGK